VAIAEALRTALAFGMVGLDTGSISLEMAPFGGMKETGLGRKRGPLERLRIG